MKKFILILLALFTVMFCAVLVPNPIFAAEIAKEEVAPLATPNITEIQSIGTQIFNLIYNVSAVLTAVAIAIGGYMYIFSHGDQDAIKKARQIVISAISGMVFLIIAKIIFQINKDGFSDPSSLIPFFK